MRHASHGPVAALLDRADRRTHRSAPVRCVECLKGGHEGAVQAAPPWMGVHFIWPGGMGVHFIWLWKHNPAGVFSPTTPTVTCPKSAYSFAEDAPTLVPHKKH